MRAGTEENVEKLQIPMEHATKSIRKFSKPIGILRGHFMSSLNENELPGTSWPLWVFPHQSLKKQ
jgi:hypothetical protein